MLLLIGIGLLMIHINRVEKVRSVEEDGKTKSDRPMTAIAEAASPAPAEGDSQGDTT